MTDDLSRDPRLESIYDRARELAREDVAADRDPRVLTGEEAEGQWVYDEEYLSRLTTQGGN